MQAAAEDDYGWLVGIDWATDAHEVCVMTASRDIVTQRKVEHSGPAIATFIEQLAKICDNHTGRVAISIEIPRGAVVESLVERGFHVYAINPKQLDRFRDRHTVAGAKDDRRDAFVLADSLRTDRPCFRRVRVDDPIVIQLREMSRVDGDLAEDMNRLTNRMREQLYRFFPQLLRLSPSADEPWLWALLELAPTPAAGARLKPKQIAKVLTDIASAVLTPTRCQALGVAGRARSLHSPPGEAARTFARQGGVACKRCKSWQAGASWCRQASSRSSVPSSRSLATPLPMA